MIGRVVTYTFIAALSHSITPHEALPRSITARVPKFCAAMLYIYYIYITIKYIYMLYIIYIYLGSLHEYLVLRSNAHNNHRGQEHALETIVAIVRWSYIVMGRQHHIAIDRRSFV
eukprot:SAG31_NODE_4559_length_3137_cov_8.827189_1_plen_115_part_00